jgi:hypothetical protein
MKTEKVILTKEEIELLITGLNELFEKQRRLIGGGIQEKINNINRLKDLLESHT